MSAADIAKRHFEQALYEAQSAGYDADATARYMLGLVVQKYLEYRSVEDVRSELQFVAENCAPNTDYVFMRPGTDAPRARLEAGYRSVVITSGRGFRGIQRCSAGPDELSVSYD